MYYTCPWNGQRTFVFKALKPVHFDHKALRARLPLDAVKWHPALYENTWLRAFIQYCELILGGEGLFEGWEKELGIAMIWFFLPAKNTSYAGCLSHCVFFLSLGTNTAFLYWKEGCSCLQTWGRGRSPLLSLLYSFVGFVAWFLKISKAWTVMFSVWLPTQLFLNLLTNFILTW